MTTYGWRSSGIVRFAAEAWVGISSLQGVGAQAGPRSCLGVGDRLARATWEAGEQASTPAFPVCR